jgi:type II secretory pathway pseudopilin PulG
MRSKAEAKRGKREGLLRHKVVWGGAAGVSLVEATIILMVFSLLTAVLAPSIRGYVNDAQQATAKKDVETIGSALSRMLADVGEAWILRDGNGVAATNPPSHAAGNRVDLMVSAGNIPAVGVVRSGAGTDWNAAVDNAATQRLEYYLVQNTPSNAAANAYRTATNMSVLAEFDPDSGAQFNAEHGWRGAYVPGSIGPDPWGNRYGVNVEFLARALGAGPSGNVNDVFVVSAGSDSTIDTRFDLDGAVSGGNDVVFVFSGGSR